MSEGELKVSGTFSGELKVSGTFSVGPVGLWKKLLLLFYLACGFRLRPALSAAERVRIMFAGQIWAFLFRALRPRRLIRRIGEFGFERFVAQAQRLSQVKLRPVIVEFEMPVFACGCIFLAGTYKDTIITAKKPTAHFFSRLRRYPAFVFYCQIIYPSRFYNG